MINKLKKIVTRASSLAARSEQRETSSQRGFSLIEVLLVVIIIGFITFLILGLPSSIGLIGTSKNSSLANDIALGEVERLRLISYDNLANGSNNFSDGRMLSLPQGAGNYIVEDCPTSICSHAEQTKKVTVAVSWKDKDQTKTISVVTFMSQGGLK